MISLIICSRNVELFKIFEQNVKETIGVPFEMVRIDNSSNQHSICSAYNKGAEKAKYNNLCFVHEDVIFRTNNWGQIALTEAEKFDLLGVAGSSYKSKNISGWASGSGKLDYGNVYHTKKNGEISHYYKNDTAITIAPCVVVDGLWLFCNKAVWRDVKFDEINLTGFHFYDVDFSLRCSLLHTVAVTFSIDILHNSLGHFNTQWLKAALQWHKVNSKKLPQFIGEKNKREITETENAIALFWIKRLRKEQLSNFIRLKYLLPMLFRRPKLVCKEVFGILYKQ